jgi:uncharacterized Zn-finger protein
MPKTTRTFYKCIKCNKIFDQKGHYDYHVHQRKRPCNAKEELEDKAESEPQVIKCNCGKIFSRKDNLARHRIFCQFNKQQNVKVSVKEATTTKPTTRVMSSKDIKHTCKYCKKDFTRSDALNKHINGKCAVKKYLDVQKELAYQKLLTQVSQKQKQIDNLRQKINISNIQLLAFGDEDNEHITDGEYKSILNKGYYSVPELVKQIHFDVNKPENHNLYITNLINDYVTTYNGIRWTIENREAVIDKLYSDKRALLMEKFDELLHDLPEDAIKRFGRFINDQQDNTVANTIKQEIKLILYNNKNIPEETKEKLGVGNYQLYD